MTFADRSLILLDLDGTLMDSAPGIIASVVHAFETHGLPVPSPDDLRRFVGPPIGTSFMTHGFTSENVAEAIGTYRADFIPRGMWMNSVFDGVPELLSTLRASGRRLAVATSKPEPFARQLTAHFGLDEHLEAVFGATLDETSRATKAAVVGYALAELGVDPAAARSDAIMVGDRSHDVHGAAEHGLATIGVAWGYADPGELESAGAVAVAADVTALRSLLLG
ncbi:HAD hydrolase-like protein [Sanguibacter sp. A247]|uniref:HAD hydrolase-like protein n=1 Tax=unclassified Sanguibacter TaxID=2645534 RepID=UPI003FD7CF0A